MKTNEIRTIIHAPPDRVFEFTVEPKNTSMWIDSAGEEKCDTTQIGIGSIYTNDYGTFEVTDYDKDVFFELTHTETGYQCSYSYRKIDDDTTELVYFESMEDGSDLVEPIKKKYFKKLKGLLEK